MIILSHRGLWIEPSEKNSLHSLNQSIQSGFGVETDIRDLESKIIVSHDIPKGDNTVLLEDFFTVYSRQNSSLVLALNIKSCGLANSLLELLKKFHITHYFVFDMAIPDNLDYINKGLIFFTRQSEYEMQPAFYDEAMGIWLDAFKSTWYNETILLNHANNKKYVCIVSPELHGREHLPVWIWIKQIIGYHDISEKILLCTDHPNEAQRFFNEND